MGSLKDRKLSVADEGLGTMRKIVSSMGLLGSQTTSLHMPTKPRIVPPWARKDEYRRKSSHKINQKGMVPKASIRKEKKNHAQCGKEFSNECNSENKTNMKLRICRGNKENQGL